MWWTNKASDFKTWAMVPNSKLHSNALRLKNCLAVYWFQQISDSIKFKKIKNLKLLIVHLLPCHDFWHWQNSFFHAAKLLQSCPTLHGPIDNRPPGSTVPGILQARTLEWVAISFSNAWKWKVKVRSLSHVRLFATPWTVAYQAFPSMGFSKQEYWSGMPSPSLLSAISLYIGLHCRHTFAETIW